MIKPGMAVSVNDPLLLIVLESNVGQHIPHLHQILPMLEVPVGRVQARPVGCTAVTLKKDIVEFPVVSAGMLINFQDLE